MPPAVYVNFYCYGDDILTRCQYINVIQRNREKDYLVAMLSLETAIG